MAKKIKLKGDTSGASMGLPFSRNSGFTATPIATILNSFHETIDWLKSEPKDETFSQAGLRGILAAVEAVKSGDIDGAIDVLRESKREIGSIRKKSLIFLVKNFLHRSKSTIFLESILSNLLNVRAVQTGNQALESFEKSKPSEDIIGRLRTMAAKAPDEGIIPYAISDPNLRRLLSSDPDFRHVLKGRLSDMGIDMPNLGPCAVCRKPSVGEMKSGDGKSWKLCPLCVENAQELLDEQKKNVNRLLDSLRKNRQDLEEAVALDRENKPAQKNLDACNKILSQLKPHTT